MESEINGINLYILNIIIFRITRLEWYKVINNRKKSIRNKSLSKKYYKLKRILWTIKYDFKGKLEILRRKSEKRYKLNINRTEWFT